MANLQLANQFPPLAWGEDGDQFAPPEEAVCWRLRRQTSGRPALVGVDESDSEIDLYADETELRRKVADLPGIYRLYPVNEQGHELYPVAKVTLLPRSRGHHDGMFMQPGNAGQMFQIIDRLLELQERNTFMATEAFKTAVTSFAGMQEGTATLLNSAATTIQVANGVEAIAREEPNEMDVEELAKKLGEAMDESDGSDKPHWALQLVPQFIQVAQGFAMQVLKMHANQAALAGAPAPAAPMMTAESAATTAATLPASSGTSAQTGSSVEADKDTDDRPAGDDQDVGDDQGVGDDQDVDAQESDDDSDNGDAIDSSFVGVELELGPAGAGHSDDALLPVELGPAGACISAPTATPAHEAIVAPAGHSDVPIIGDDPDATPANTQVPESPVAAVPGDKGDDDGVIALGPARTLVTEFAHDKGRPDEVDGPGPEIEPGEGGTSPPS